MTNEIIEIIDDPETNKLPLIENEDLEIKKKELENTLAKTDYIMEPNCLDTITKYVGYSVENIFFLDFSFYGLKVLL